MISRFAEALRQKLRENSSDYAGDMATRTCRTFDEYQYLCGVIRGLALAEQHLNDLQKHVEKDEDE